MNAHRRKEAKGQHFTETIEGNRICAQFSTYHIRCDDGQVDVLYGRHVETMEVTGAAESMPSQNCIQYSGFNYAVWPSASPHSKQCGHDMNGLCLQIPAGWQLVDSTQKDFPNILDRVIKPYGWHTARLVTQGQGGQLTAWQTACYGSDAGMQHFDPSLVKKDGSSFRFTPDTRV